MTTTQTPDPQTPPIFVSVGFDPRAQACVSPAFPEVFHYPMPGWPEMAHGDGFATYCLKLAAMPGDPIPTGMPVRVAEESQGADAMLGALVLTIRSSGGPSALTPDIRGRTEVLAARLAAITCGSERPWEPGSRISGIRDPEVVDMPEVAALLHHPSTQACLSLITDQWTHFLTAVLGDQELHPGIGAARAREILVEKLPECRVAGVAVPGDMTLLSEHVAAAPLADTRWRPVVLASGREIHFHSSFLHGSLGVPPEESLRTLVVLARRLSALEQALGTASTWRPLASPRCVYRTNVRDGGPQIPADVVAREVEDFLARVRRRAPGTN